MKAVTAISWTVGALAILIAWELGSRIMTADTIPGPRSVLSVISENSLFFLNEGLVSSLHAGIGLGLAILIAMTIVTTIGCVPETERFFYPYIIVIQATPAVAFVPIYVSLVGYGIWAKILTAAMIAFVPIVIGGIDGMRKCPDRLESLGASYGAGRLATFLNIRLPYAICGGTTGVKTAAPLAVVGALVGEYVAGGRPTGLGTYILRSYAEFFPTQVFAGVVASGTIGLLFFAGAYLVSEGVFRLFRVREYV